ncbi:pyridoxamine 5'-phosphate oxidase family protein [Streptomyces sp. NPDC048623]|uniref:pyridoxamine 5'-phosphate oxidase family protein n=1 Tax=Streptomyces sp. NPDC048623 TaxID=3155761 RepID=UPI003412C3C4
MHDEAVRDRTGAEDTRPGRRTVELDGAEALQLLSTVPLGRIVFTRRALPAVRPVNHLVDAGDIVLRTHEGAALTTHAREAGSDGVVVAYEADQIDLVTRLGWSVVVTGYCLPVTDPAEADRYRALLHPWTDQRNDEVLRIRPDLVTGIRLVPAVRPATPKTA